MKDLASLPMAASVNSVFRRAGPVRAQGSQRCTMNVNQGRDHWLFSNAVRSALRPSRGRIDEKASQARSNPARVEAILTISPLQTLNQATTRLPCASSVLRSMPVMPTSVITFAGV